MVSSRRAQARICAWISDGSPFEEKMKRLVATLREQQTEAARLDAAIASNLKELGYGG
jgi:type I restriction enzyme M protein